MQKGQGGGDDDISPNHFDVYSFIQVEHLKVPLTKVPVDMKPILYTKITNPSIGMLILKSYSISVMYRYLNLGNICFQSR